MKIKKGITVKNLLNNGYDALTINSGVIHHLAQTTPQVKYESYCFTPNYEEDAYVVKRDWRALTNEEKNCLKPPKDTKIYNTIYTGNIPKKLKDLFQEMNLSSCKNRDEVLESFKKEPAKTEEVSRVIYNFLKPISQEKPFHFHFLGSNLPNVEMVACDTTVMPSNYKEEDKKYMGLHNDGYEQMPIYTINKAGNRICINLGKETRSFAFMNISLIQAFNMLKKKIDVKKHGVDIVNISKFFFKYYPDYPVIRIRMKPYQFYIAPTDNCFHDGSTLNNKELDIIIVYFGKFKI